MVSQAQQMAPAARETVLAGVKEAEERRAAREQGGASPSAEAAAADPQAVNPFGRAPAPCAPAALSASSHSAVSVLLSPQPAPSPPLPLRRHTRGGFGINQTAAALFSRRFPELAGETYHATCPVMWREGGRDQQGQLYVTDGSIALHGTFGRGKQIVKLSEVGGAAGVKSPVSRRVRAAESGQAPCAEEAPRASSSNAGRGGDGAVHRERQDVRVHGVHGGPAGGHHHWGERARGCASVPQEAGSPSPPVLRRRRRFLPSALILMTGAPRAAQGALSTPQSRTSGAGREERSNSRRVCAICAVSFVAGAAGER